MTDSPLASIRGLSVTFPGQKALDDVDLDIFPGEVHALCGANGSGKSTMIKVLSRFYKADPGASITLPEGGDERGARMHFIHQDLGLIDTLDVAENLALSGRSSGRPLSPLGRKAEYRRARMLLRRLGVQLNVRLPVGELRASERTMVALARATQDWDGQAGVLVLDEPTVSLPPSEVRRLFDVVRQIRDSGAGVLFVSHRTEEVLDLADRITVLRDGRVMGSAPRAEWTATSLVNEIVGKELGEAPQRAQVGRTVRLAVRGVRTDSLADVSFDLHEGEILGIAGLIGSGMEDLPDALFGATRIDAGELVVDGTTVELRNHNPRAAIGRGLALVPSDRAVKGAVLDHTIRENITLPALRPVRKSTGLSRTRENRDAGGWARNVELQGRDLERPLAMLSGGNQQKVVIARWLRTAPRILLMHEPTQGVDVGAKAAIYSLLAQVADTGAAVLIVSTDSGDFEQVAHRVLLLEGGRVSDEFTGADVTAHRINTRLLSGSMVASAR